MSNIENRMAETIFSPLCVSSITFTAKLYYTPVLNAPTSFGKRYFSKGKGEKERKKKKEKRKKRETSIATRNKNRQRGPRENDPQEGTGRVNRKSTLHRRPLSPGRENTSITSAFGALLIHVNYRRDRGSPPWGTANSHGQC